MPHDSMYGDAVRGPSDASKNLSKAVLVLKWCRDAAGGGQGSVAPRQLDGVNGVSSEYTSFIIRGTDSANP